jgi:hypothetical protein
MLIRWQRGGFDIPRSGNDSLLVTNGVLGSSIFLSKARHRMIKC